MDTHLSPIAAGRGLFRATELVGIGLVTLACVLLLIGDDRDVAWAWALAFWVAGLTALTLDFVWRWRVSQHLRDDTEEEKADPFEVLSEPLEQLSSLPNEALEKVARDRFPEKLSRELETLNLKDQREGLTESEQEKREKLLQGYERVILLRAEAALVLKTRGQAVDNLLRSG